MPETFAVRVGEFEGPLDLLLKLVEERELQINKISLATVADSFLEYLKELPRPTMEILGNFVVIASTLILIKSISLLPTLPVTSEEEEQIGDLERRLKLYQLIRETSSFVREALATPLIFYRDPRQRVVNPIFSPTPEITLPALHLVIEQLVRNLPKTEILPTTSVKRLISIESVIADLTRRMESVLSMSFKDFVKDKSDKISVIVSFLALLELFKQGLVSVTQPGHFSDIKIETRDSNTPRYG
ncbi:MAG TPA: ScpA family protein [Candidatus Paceibacterota bacterium]